MRILIVEDERRLAEALGQIMAEQRYQADVVFDGADGLDYALTGQYDAIVLDVMLPKVDGFEVARRLRCAHVSTPILMLTARDEIPDKIAGLDHGADDYMTKPFDIGELLARVRALTRRQGEVIGEQLAAGDLVLDTPTRSLQGMGPGVGGGGQQRGGLHLLPAEKAGLSGFPGEHRHRAQGGLSPGGACGMIKRLRRKFILINLLLVGLVLAVVFILFVGANVRRLAGQSDAALRLALSWQEGEGPPRFEIGGPPPEEHEPDGAHRFSLIPVFVVTVKDGAITGLNDGGQVDVSEETAAEAVKQAQSSGASQGVLRELRLRFLVERRPDGELRIAFADLGWETASLRNLSLLSLLVWALAMVGLFFVSLVLSSVALRPAERAWQQQRQFVADASHELKTPLTVILANTGLVLSHPEDTVAAQSKWLEYTHDEAEQMKELVDDLLFLAKSDAARQPAARAETAMSEVALGCLLPFESVAFEAGVALEHRITPGLSLRGDEGQLRRLVMILLDNAVKYAGPGGTVTLTLERHQERLRLAVHNTGEPIPPEHLPHLFERFYRADAARNRSGGGYGLGLAIARSIVEGHHGRLTVTSTAAAGTTFTALLPRR